MCLHVAIWQRYYGTGVQAVTEPCSQCTVRFHCYASVVAHYTGGVCHYSDVGADHM